MILAGTVAPLVLGFKAVGVHADGFARYKFFAGASRVFDLTDNAAIFHIAQLVFGALFLHTFFLWHRLFPQRISIVRLSNAFAACSIACTLIVWIYLS